MTRCVLDADFETLGVAASDAVADCVLLLDASLLGVGVWLVVVLSVTAWDHVALLVHDGVIVSLGVGSWLNVMLADVDCEHETDCVGLRESFWLAVNEGVPVTVLAWLRVGLGVSERLILCDPVATPVRVKDILLVGVCVEVGERAWLLDAERVSLLDLVCERLAVAGDDDCEDVMDGDAVRLEETLREADTDGVMDTDRVAVVDCDGDDDRLCDDESS